MQSFKIFKTNFIVYFSKLKKQYKIRNLFFSKTIAFSLFQGKIILGLYGNKKNNKFY